MAIEKFSLLLERFGTGFLFNVVKDFEIIFENFSRPTSLPNSSDFKVLEFLEYSEDFNEMDMVPKIGHDIVYSKENFKSYLFEGNEFIKILNYIFLKKQRNSVILYSDKGGDVMSVYISFKNENTVKINPGRFFRSQGNFPKDTKVFLFVKKVKLKTKRKPAEDLAI